MIVVPEVFAKETVAREGEAGREWIERLPRLVEELLEAWALTVDGAAMHGAIGLVLPVRRRDEPAILKVSWIDEETVDEAAALAAWDGNGAVRLYHHDPERGGMLLERLDSGRDLESLPIDRAVDIAADLLRALAIERVDGIRRRVRDWAIEQVETLPVRQHELGDPLPPDVVRTAVEYAATLGPSAGSMLLSRDLHYRNVLAGKRAPWLMIDPKPMLGDLEFALGPLLWRRTGEPPGNVNPRVAEDRLARLVVRAGLDAGRARGWTLVRCVDYALWAHGHGLTWDAATCRELAVLLARA